jgi:lycopene beta-cyclase
VLVIGDRRHEAARTYVQIDNRRLQQQLRDRLAATGGSVVAGSARAVEGGRVEIEDGGRRHGVEASLVIDATGADTPFVLRERAQGVAAVQSAYGLVAEVTGMPNQGAAVLMDWSGPDRRDPSFLYALDYGGGVWLVEETSLAHRPGLSDGELERRLQERLAMIGAQIISVQRVERVRFPMDVPMPMVPQVVVAAGAAAAIVHPATGYSVAASLRIAGDLAAAIARSPGDAKASWAAVWPRRRIAARRLERYGMERLLTMDQRTTRAFFDAFFSLPPHRQAAYLGGTATPGELSVAMARVFAASPWRVRRALIAGNPLPLAKGLLLRR